MKTPSRWVVLAIVALVIAFAVRAILQHSEAITALAALARQSAAERASIAGLEQRLQSAKARLAQTGQEMATGSDERGIAGAVAAAGARAAGEPPNKFKASAGRLSPETVIANDPQQMAEYAKSFRATLELTCGGMFKALHLSPEQIERFKDLKVELEQRRMDLVATVETQGIDQQGDTYFKLVRQQRSLTREREAELFGPGPLLAHYREYAGTQPLREASQLLASSLASPDAPITAAQVERVTEIVAQNSQRRPGEVWASGHWGTINWDAAGAQLRGLLLPSQLATLRLVMRQMEAWTPIAIRNIELDAEAKTISRQTR